jgi:hypothetical protein
MLKMMDDFNKGEFFILQSMALNRLLGAVIYTYADVINLLLY